MIEEKLFDDCLCAASLLDGRECVNGGGMAGIYIGRTINDSLGWIAKADWSNQFEIFAHGENPTEAMINLTNKLRGM